jgi:hypothetical protein
MRQDDINHLNMCITNNEIEAGIKSPPRKISPGSGGITAEFYHILTKNTKCSSNCSTKQKRRNITKLIL